MENQEYKWRQRKKRNTKIAIWIILVILICVGATFVYEGMKESDPLKVAERYFRQEEAINDFEVVTGERSLNDQNQFVQEYTFTYTADGKEVSQTVNMIQKNEKKYGIFEQWEMTSASANTVALALIVPADSQVLLNGVAPDETQIQEDENLSPAAVRYALSGIDADCTIQVNGLPFDSYEGTLDTSSSIVDIREQLVVGENAQTQMLEIAKSMINELFTAAVEDKSADDLGTLFDNAPNKANLYRVIKNNLYKSGELLVDSIAFEGFEAAFGDVYYSGKDEDGYIGMEMKLSYTCKYEPAAQEEEEETETGDAGEEEETETEETEAEISAQKEATFYFKYQGGNCIVTSVEIPNVI